MGITNTVLDGKPWSVKAISQHINVGKLPT